MKCSLLFFVLKERVRWARGTCSLVLVQHSAATCSLLRSCILDGLELRLDVLHLTIDAVNLLVNPSELETDAQVCAVGDGDERVRRA